VGLTDLEGKVTLVTGGSSGIGRATALAVARRGGAVVVADLDPDGGRETQRLITDGGGTAEFARTDVTDPASVQDAVRLALQAFGRLDGACNSAGFDPPVRRLAEQELEDWERSLAVNLTGAFLCMKHEIRAMLDVGGSGAIVNVASIGGLRGLWGHAPYAAAKHGLVGLTRTAAIDYAKKGIRVNAVCPGPVETPMLRRYMDEVGLDEAQLAKGQPMGRPATVDEVAEAITWLLSPGSSYVTGQAIGLDGGWLA
jgi:NAD(P)-dependent dehydrogenase (short-subunit alcohol dehydrogenase family)